MKRTLPILLSLAVCISARASGVAALGDIACGIYTNTAAAGIPYVANAWLDEVLHVSLGPYTPNWWTDYGVTEPNASPAPDAAATTGQLKWCVRQAAALLDNVATNVGGAGSWLFWTAANLPPDDNDVAVTVAEFAALVEPVVDRVQQLEIDSMYTSADGSSISNLFDYGSYSNEPVSLAHLKNVFNFDPEIDSYADGIPDWWQRYYGLISWGDYGEGDPNADFDWDGISDLDEWRLGLDPTARDTDGDGLVDGADPDPSDWTDPRDDDGDGLPDAFESGWFGSTNAIGSSDVPAWAGFLPGMALAAGVCPTNPAPETTYPARGLSSLRLVPRFGVEAVSNDVVWSRSFDLDDLGEWERRFVSSVLDPGSAGEGFWELDGLVLEWSPGTSYSGEAAFSEPDGPLQLPIPAKDENAGTTSFWLELRATRTGLVKCPQPLYLLSYTPEIVFTNSPVSSVGGELVYAAACGEDVPFSVDRSSRPAGPFSAAERTALPFAGICDAASLRTGPDGEIVGGVLRGVPAGVHDVPWIGPPAPESAPLRSMPPAPPQAIRLVAIAPQLVFGRYTHFYERWRLRYDPANGLYSTEDAFPLDTPELQRMFHCRSDGAYVCGCTPEIELGVPPPYDLLFATNAPVVAYDAPYQIAEGTVSFSGVTLWTGSARHRPDGRSPDPVDSGDDCDCGNGTELDGASLGSVGFRVSLGQPRAGQLSGFLWFHSDGPVEIGAGTFRVLARSDSTIADTTANGVRTVSCSDARGRTLVISPIANGVRIVVTTTASGALDHTWEIVNENGDPARVRIRKLSRAGNTLSDETFVRSSLGWGLFTPIDGTTRTVVRHDGFADPSCPTGTVEEVLVDASGLELEHTFIVRRRVGDYGDAVLREIERREDVGTPFEKTYLSSYWEAPGERNGLPRLLSGDARAWSWTDYDALGRPILAFEQLEGSPVPANLDDGTRWTLGNRPSGLRSFATVYGYAPLPGDTTNVLDNSAPRTVSRYVVDGGAPVLIARTWSVYVRGTNAGLPSVTVRTERAASQAAAFGDPSNAVSAAVSVDPDAEGVPLLLRGRPLSYTDEDGVTTSYEYAYGSWDAAAKVFAAASGASHLRTIVRRSTPEAPTGIPYVSTADMTVEDAVYGNELFSGTLLDMPGVGAADLPLLTWEARVYDDQDRLRSTLYSDGSTSTNAYSCCRLLSTIGRDGAKTLRSAKTGTDHLYYATEEVSLAELPHYTNSTPYSGWTAADYRVTQHFMDALGRETESVTCIGRSPGQATNAVFASSGAWTSSEETRYEFGSSDFSFRIDANYNHFASGRTDTATNSASWSENGYGWIPGVSNYHKKDTSTFYRGGRTVTLREEGTNWVRTTSSSSYGSDGRRMDVSVTETSDGACVTNSVSVSDPLGRIVRVTTPLSESTYAYDGASSRAVSVSDSVSGLSTATIYDALREPVGSVSAGVSSLSNTRYELSSNVWWRVTETREAADAQTNLLSTVRERLTGLSDSLRSETVSIDENGVVTHAVSSFDPATKILTETTSSPIAPTVVRKSKFGREIERTEDGETVRSFYDPFGRVFARRRSGGTGVNYYDRLEALYARNGHGYVMYETRPVSASDAAVTERYYDSVGHVYREYDATGHGREFAYDLSGRVTEESGDTVYPSLQSYDALGRRVSLSTTRNGTAWDVTRWGWDAATGLCTNKTYADGSSAKHTFTPDGLPLRTTLASGAWTQNAYDASRRLASVSTSDGEGDHALSYDAFGRVTDAVGPDTQYHYVRDALGRVTCESRDDAFANPLSSISRSFDEFGRPAGCTLEFAPDFPDDFRQSVCYDWGMDGKLAGMTLSNAQGRAVEISFDWDRGRGVGWRVDGLSAPWASFSQTLLRDAWRPRLVTSCAAGNDFVEVRSFSYAYNKLGRPVERDFDGFAYNARGEVTNAVLGGAAYRYAYDHIGNRTSATEAGATTSYSANSVNQYTEVGFDEPEYDEDGNLVDDGTRTFSWSAAGRMTEASAGDIRVRSVYDWRGRRIERYVERIVGQWPELVEMRQFVYDDWNLIHEYRYDGDAWTETELEYFWGPDLSGSLQGAGGVGGLVAVSIDGDYYFPGYDNNGNVIGYWDENGSLVAEYAYDAFGNTISSSGSMADVFPHRFSTKYYDAETDLYYYGYRYYSPSLGRWISRDPIEERDSLGLYCFSRNNGLSNFDTLGLFHVKIMARDNPDTGRKRKIFSSWQVPVRRDVKIVGAGGYFTTQDESYHTFLEVEFSRWTGKCCEIRLFPGIFIDPSVQTLAEFESGQTIGVTGHFPAPGEQEGIGNGPYELVYPHERGHAEVFFEWAVPRLISKLEPYCTNGKRYKTEWAKKFARASIGLDAQIILHTPVYLTESNKRADKLAAEKMYLLPSYGFVEKFPPVTGIAWDVRRYKRVWEKK